MPPTEQPAVFLACPHYGDITAPTAGSLLTASAKFCPYVNFEAGSLLAFTFNRLWCEALNMRKHRQLNFFAMLHADVCPDPGWLDVLVEEMAATGADVVSAVIPLKDGRGLTSTARRTADGGHRRLTMQEVFKLPPTFDAKSAGWGDDLLLVNTGCWVCDFTKPWAEEFPGFHIEDYLCRGDDGVFRAGVFSEDWRASVWWAERGLKVCATRKVKAGHVGKSSWRNERPFGEWDQDYGDHRDPTDGIHGWMNRPELEWLRRKAAACHNIAEVGCWHGRSTHALAGATPGMVFAVDHFRGSPGDPDSELTDAVCGDEARAAFRRNLAPHLESGKVVLLEAESAEAAAAFAPPAFDMVFLDADHGYESVCRDIRAWLPLVRKGGTLAGHDRNRAGVARAVAELLPGWREAAGTIWEYEV